LVALVQALKALAQQARENGDAAIFACIAECILGCIQSILEYFNKVCFFIYCCERMLVCKILNALKLLLYCDVILLPVASV
jgi:hypothetical protein